MTLAGTVFLERKNFDVVYLTVTDCDVLLMGVIAMSSSRSWIARSSS
jgi:hypothetical protein